MMAIRLRRRVLARGRATQTCLAGFAASPAIARGVGV